MKQPLFYVPRTLCEIKYCNLLVYIYLSILGAGGAALIIHLSSGNGIGVSPDSVMYISVARNFGSGNGFLGYDEYALVLQPPLYPVMLSAAELLFNTDMLSSAGFLNGIFFGLTIFFTGMYLLRLFSSVFISLAGASITAVSYVMMQSSLIALSEAPFILLLVLFLICFDAYKGERNKLLLLLFSIITSLACLTRYAGVVCVVTGGVGISLLNGRSWKMKVQDLSLFVLITILPIGIWIVRNLKLSGTIMGHRGGSSYTITENIGFIVNTLMKWFIPLQSDAVQIMIASGVFLLMLIASGIFLFASKKEIDSTSLGKAAPSLLLIFLYIALIAISSTTTAYDTINTRLLSPVFVPVIVCVFAFFAAVAQAAARYVHPWVVTGLLVIPVFFWGEYHLSRTSYLIHHFEQYSGLEYSSNKWSDNSVINYIILNKDLLSDCIFYSNAPDAVYIHSGSAARWSPSKAYYNSPVPASSKNMEKELWYEKKPVCLIWFNGINRNFLFTPDELRNGSVLVKIAGLRDGDIYTIER